MLFADPTKPTRKRSFKNVEMKTVSPGAPHWGAENWMNRKIYILIQWDAGGNTEHELGGVLSSSLSMLVWPVWEKQSSWCNFDPTPPNPSITWCTLKNHFNFNLYSAIPFDFQTTLDHPMQIPFLIETILFFKAD